MNFDTLKSLVWWLLIGGLFFWMMRRGGCGMMMGGDHGRRTPEDDAAPRYRSASGKPIDPVCNMEVDPGKAVGTRLVMGETIFFCSPMCLEAFDKNPTAYARAHRHEGSHRHQHAGC